MDEGGGGELGVPGEPEGAVGGEGLTIKGELSDAAGGGGNREGVAGVGGFELGMFAEEGHGYGEGWGMRDADGEDFVLAAEAFVFAGDLEHEVVGGEVGTVGGAFAVVALVAGVEGKDGGVGVEGAPFAPGGGDDVEEVELDAGVGQGTDDGLALEGGPEGVGGLIEHELAGLVEEAGGAEGVTAGAIGDDGAAEGAVDEAEGFASEGVIGHFVPSEDALGVGAGLAVAGEAEDDVVVLEVGSLGGGDVFRLDERGDAVDDDAAPFDLVEADAGGGETVGREEGLEAGVKG